MCEVKQHLITPESGMGIYAHVLYQFLCHLIESLCALWRHQCAGTKTMEEAMTAYIECAPLVPRFTVAGPCR